MDSPPPLSQENSANSLTWSRSPQPSTQQPSFPLSCRVNVRLGRAEPPVGRSESDVWALQPKQVKCVGTGMPGGGIAKGMLQASFPTKRGLESWAGHHIFLPGCRGRDGALLWSPAEAWPTLHPSGTLPIVGPICLEDERQGHPMPGFLHSHTPCFQIATAGLWV